MLKARTGNGLIMNYMDGIIMFMSSQRQLISFLISWMLKVSYLSLV